MKTWISAENLQWIGFSINIVLPNFCSEKSKSQLWQHIFFEETICKLFQGFIVYWKGDIVKQTMKKGSFVTIHKLSPEEIVTHIFSLDPPPHIMKLKKKISNTKLKRKDTITPLFSRPPYQLIKKISISWKTKTLQGWNKNSIRQRHNKYNKHFHIFQYFQIYRELAIFLMDSCLTTGRCLQGKNCIRKDQSIQWQTWVVCTKSSEVTSSTELARWPHIDW